ncbi:hypothetical protein PSKAS_03410 [Peribacillus sp. N1]
MFKINYSYIMKNSLVLFLTIISKQKKAFNGDLSENLRNLNDITNALFPNYFFCTLISGIKAKLNRQTLH